MKGKKFLILQRSTKETSMHGLWGAPWWQGRTGRNPRQTAIIEVKEEAGLDIKLKTNLGPHHDNKKKKKHTTHTLPSPRKTESQTRGALCSQVGDSSRGSAMPDAKVSHHLLYFLKKNPEIFPISAQGYHKMVSSAITKARKNPGHSKKVEKGKKLYKHMNGKEPEKIEKKKIDMGDVWHQVGEGGCWQIGYMSGKETGNAKQKYTHTFNEETQDGNFPKLYATMPESGKSLLIIQGGTWKISIDDKGACMDL